MLTHRGAKLPLDPDPLLAALAASMPFGWADASQARDAAAWTAALGRALHDTAARLELSCCCEIGPHAAEGDAAAGVPRGYNRRHLWDLTWYREWSTWELPLVAIQLQNAHRFDAWLADHWALMASAAPVRVSAGFTATASDWSTWLSLLQQISDESGWAFPPQSADLVLLGHVGVEPGGLRVLRRDRGEREWRDGGTLRSFTRA